MLRPFSSQEVTRKSGLLGSTHPAVVPSPAKRASRVYLPQSCLNCSRIRSGPGSARSTALAPALSVVSPKEATYLSYGCEIHFAPPKKLWNTHSPVNTSKQWFPMVSKWCKMDIVHGTGCNGAFAMYAVPQQCNARDDLARGGGREDCERQRGNRACALCTCWGSRRFDSRAVLAGLVSRQPHIAQKLWSGDSVGSPLSSATLRSALSRVIS